MHLEQDEARRRAATADHGTLATINQTGAPDLVPACFAMVGEHVGIPIDTLKPKRSTALGRVRNLEGDPRATLLLEHWDAGDWSRLWWVRVSLVRVDLPAADVDALEMALRDRYPQYRAVGALRDIVTFRIEWIGGWESAS